MDEKVEQQSFVFVFVGSYEGKKGSKTMRVKHTYSERAYLRELSYLCALGSYGMNGSCHGTFILGDERYFIL